MTLLSAFPKQRKQFRSNGRQCLGVFYMLGVWLCLSQQKQSLYLAVGKNNQKTPNSCPVWNPSKIPGGNRHEIHYYLYITERNSQKSGTQTVWNLNKNKSNQTFRITAQVQKKQNNRLCTKCEVMGEIGLLPSACLLLCWLVVCLQTN